MCLRHPIFFVALFVALSASGGPWSRITVGQGSDVSSEKETDKSIIQIWPGGLPKRALHLDEKRIIQSKHREQQNPGIVAYVDKPSFTVFQPPVESSNGCAVIICPGGGYNILAWRKEGLEVAEYLNSHGITAFVLKYRVPRRDPSRFHFEPMQDLQRATRLIRSRASLWEIDPDRIGLLGFSAGGHLVVMAGTEYETRSYSRIDDIDDLSCRPNFICPIYAAYLGENYEDDKPVLSDKIKLNENTPPTFLAVTSDDKKRGPQAALLYLRLSEMNVSSELHVYSKGGHGYGIRPNRNPAGTWHHRLIDWMKTSGFLEKRKG